MIYFVALKILLNELIKAAPVKTLMPIYLQGLLLVLKCKSQVSSDVLGIRCLISFMTKSLQKNKSKMGWVSGNPRQSLFQCHKSRTKL